jgi:hypothetical protein
MTTARQFLDLVRAYERFKTAQEDPERVVMELSDEHLTMLLQTVAVTFSQLKREAVRRGTWDGLVQKGLGLKKADVT